LIARAELSGEGGVHVLSTVRVTASAGPVARVGAKSTHACHPRKAAPATVASKKVPIHRVFLESKVAVPLREKENAASYRARRSF